MTANLREWVHVLKLRTSNAAHPDIRDLMRRLQNELSKLLPEILEEVGDGTV
jgi:thymidylate synthase (FAD)